MENCEDRYGKVNIQMCKVACLYKPGCVAINWADLGGDQNHVDKLVCTLYDSDTPTHTWGTTQIFCKMDETAMPTPSPV